jgi:hypothetical protein
MQELKVKALHLIGLVLLDDLLWDQCLLELVFIGVFILSVGASRERMKYQQDHVLGAKAKQALGFI